MDLQSLKQQKPLFLQAAKRKGYVCPVCNNGTGASGDGIVQDSGNKKGALLHLILLLSAN